MNKKKRNTGRYIEKSVGDESYRCFVPHPLPPTPSIRVNEFYSLLDKASVSLGELNAIRKNLPDVSLLINMFSRKEAVLSSQIEGTQSTLSDLLMFEKNLDDKHTQLNDDNTETANYLTAMNHGLEKIQSLSLSRRLFCEIHEKLLSSGRGSKKSPGEFRTSQNWIGGDRPGNAIFVPPPPEELSECFGKFEKFLNDETYTLPILVKVAISHVQFETIHPFLDGNGRLGRLLITFMLCVSGCLRDPLLYLSLFFKTHRNSYYSLLQGVREAGNWEGWVKFFLTGVYETSKNVSSTARRIVTQFEQDEEKIKNTKKDTAGVLKTFNYLKKNPITDAKSVVDDTNISLQTVSRSLKTLMELGMVKELTGRHRKRIFVYSNYIKILSN